MISRLIGICFSWQRDHLARALVRVGARPNVLTVLGMLLTVGAGAAIAMGPSYWRTWVLALLIGSGACDLLDGAMAKLGGLGTRFGGILDSVCDRVSDAALYFGPAVYFMLPDEAHAPGAVRPNITLVILAMAGLVWAFSISYIKARAEAAGARAGGGFWQRPERIVTILLGTAFHHVGTALWILALWPLTTLAHRLWRARRTARMAEAGASAEELDALRPQGLARLVLWNWARGTIPFDIHAGTVILMLIFWDIPAIDPLRALTGW